MNNSILPSRSFFSHGIKQSASIPLYFLSSGPARPTTSYEQICAGPGLREITCRGWILKPDILGLVGNPVVAAAVAMAAKVRLSTATTATLYNLQP